MLKANKMAVNRSMQPFDLNRCLPPAPLKKKKKKKKKLSNKTQSYGLL